MSDKEISMETCNDDIPLFSLDGTNTQCKIVHVYDADTCRAVMKLNNKLCKFTLRLEGIDSPEMRPSKDKEGREEEIKAAKKARNRLIQMVTDQELDVDDVKLNKKIISQLLSDSRKLINIHCGGFDKYGRLLATLYESEGDKSINERLIEEGHGYSYNGGTKKKINY